MEEKFKITDDNLMLHALGLLSAVEARQMDVFLKNNPSWQQKFVEIQNENELISSMNFEVPDADFSEKVVAAWVLESARLNLGEKSFAADFQKKKSKNWVIRSIFSVFGLIVFASIFILFFSVNGQPVADNFRVPLPNFDFERLFLHPGLPFAILFVLTLVGLQFLDKIIRTRQFLKFQN